MSHFTKALMVALSLCPTAFVALGCDGVQDSTQPPAGSITVPDKGEGLPSLKKGAQEKPSLKP
jgi:hypothetical protein